MNKKKSLFGIAVLGLTTIITITAAILPTSASASGFYIGADMVQRKTVLANSWGSEIYTTSHARIKGGYEILEFLTVEAHVMTAGNDTDIDSDGVLLKLDTGTTIGVYAKPKTSYANANVYGLVGFSLWNTTRTEVEFGVSATDAVVTFGAGVGGEFNITQNLRFNIEGMLQIGGPDYNGYSPGLYSLNLATGLSYRF